MTESNEAELHKTLGHLRELLTNYSRRNQDLYFKPRAHSLNLTIDPYQSLRVQEGGYQKEFVGLQTSSDILRDFITSGTLDASEHFHLSDSIGSTNSSDVERIRKRLVKSLDKIRLADQRYKKEYGISGSWLMGPFICWRSQREYEAGDLVISPIFKIPVDVHLSRQREWTIVLEDDSLRINPSFRLFVRHAWGIELPEQCVEESIDEALLSLPQLLKAGGKELIQSAIREFPRLLPRRRSVRDDNGVIIGSETVNIDAELTDEEKVLYGQVTQSTFVLVPHFYISQVNASKMALVEDYDRMMSSSMDHAIIKALLGGVPVSEPLSVPDVQTLDKASEEKNYFVMAVDSTQHRAVQQSIKESVLAIQGPPGTGKSQTITNLIAAYVSEGKRVLFVSEKRAALDVVYTRLQKARIADLSVLLHSSDLNRSELYQSFLNVYGLESSTEGTGQWQTICKDLEVLKEDLSRYRSCLAAIHKESGLSVSDICVNYASCGPVPPDSELRKRVGEIRSDQLRKLGEGLKEVQMLAHEYAEISTSPWKLVHESVVDTASFRAVLEEQHQKVSELVKEHNRYDDELLAYTSYSADDFETGARIDTYLRSCDASFQKTMVLLGSEREERNDLTARLQDFLVRVREKQEFVSQFTESVEEDEVRFLYEYFKEDRSVLSFVWPSFWKMRGKALSVLKDGWHYRDARAYRGYLDYREVCGEFQEFLRSIQYPERIDDSSPEQCEASIQSLIERVEALVDLGTLRQRVEETEFSTSFDSYSTIDKLCAQLDSVRETFQKRDRALASIKEVTSKIDQYFDRPFSWGDIRTIDSSTKHLLECVGHLDVLQSLMSSCKSTGVRSDTPQVWALVRDYLLEAIEDPWDAYVRSQYMNKWFDEVKSSYRPLREYENTYFSRKLERFSTLEEQHREAAQDEVLRTWDSRRKSVSSNNPGVRLLTKEAHKKRRILTPREIMEKGALDTMLMLKPVWLMSPLSISQMLPLESGLFDVIIFDEASQVRVEDAMPSIYRASSMIVVGDQQQMPPSDFFDVSQDEDHDEQEFEEIPESILDLSLHVYPHVLLQWHFRSRREALIAYSNRAFYGGQLVAAPNAEDGVRERPIEFHQIEEAYFSSRQGNRKEAEVLVERLYELLKENPERSIGVLAMGITQVKCIDEVLDERIEEDDTFASLLEKASSLKEGEADIGFFVKNLENVQGDERDIIMMSVGYAASGPGKALYKNFGPLSKKGGGRRLNVAATRARSRILVFCSFDPAEIPQDEAAFNRNPDSTYFGRYLSYTKAVSEGNATKVEHILESFSDKTSRVGVAVSPLAKALQLALVERGYQVSERVGVCGYFIDLAIRHPDNPECFILGIECDGPSFFSSAYARDRDKIRESLLRARGWNLLRVWPHDWALDAEKETQRVVDLLEKLRTPNAENFVHVH